MGTTTTSTTLTRARCHRTSTATRSIQPTMDTTMSALGASRAFPRWLRPSSTNTFHRVPCRPWVQVEGHSAIQIYTIRWEAIARTQYRHITNRRSHLTKCHIFPQGSQVHFLPGRPHHLLAAAWASIHPHQEIAASRHTLEVTLAPGTGADIP